MSGMPDRATLRLLLPWTPHLIYKEIAEGNPDGQKGRGATQDGEGGGTPAGGWTQVWQRAHRRGRETI